MRVAIYYSTSFGLDPLTFFVTLPARHLLGLFKTVVSRVSEHYQVLSPIVISDRVDMMNVLSMQQPTSQLRLHYQSVFTNPTTSLTNVDFNVSRWLTPSSTILASEATFPSRMSFTFFSQPMKPIGAGDRTKTLCTKSRLPHPAAVFTWLILKLPHYPTLTTRQHYVK